MPNDTDIFNDESDVPEIPPDASITQELFLKWRSPRFGSSNPELMTNPVWDWLVNTKISAFQAAERFKGPDAFSAGPGWCFNRFGQSKTLLPDGRIVLIAGEHEDYYDPDFFIYNDVVVRHPDGKIEIFGYPQAVFPPTDFHSATIVGNMIIILGNVGYSEARKSGLTQTRILDITSFVITSVQSSGESPGWIHGHTATLSEDRGTILLRHGKIIRDDGNTLVENIDDWRLHLADWRWERLTDRRWLRWEVLRPDGKRNHLWEIEQALWSRSVGRDKRLDEDLSKLEEALGLRPDLDLLETLFQPPISHESIAQAENEHRVFRIKIGGIVVRYVNDGYSIQVTIEGDLDQPSIDAVTSDLVRKMSALENVSCVLKPI
ncbi:MAG TPA: hypothetical protein VMB21_02785 [Candidatus Limnocylindria bacterium]|jgi:hypothetical protein|nr:hypothetical protein [Candidatus Limnocylindria bacterium]